MDKKPHILVVDDDELVRKVVLRLLDFLGYDALGAGDENEAVSLFDNHRKLGSPFDAVILDHRLPGGRNGKEVLKALRKMEPSIKAILTSGDLGQDPSFLIQEAKRNGLWQGVIPKPFEMDSLRQTLKEVLG